MATHEIDAEAVAEQLGTEGIENLVTNAERICTYEQQRIELTNRGPILSLQAEYTQLRAEDQRTTELLRNAPPSGDMRRLRRRAIYSWVITVLLTIAAFFFTLLTFEPFRLGWKGWLYSVGIAVVTPFLVDKLLERSEIIVKVLTALAATAAVAGLMLFAVIRGNLMAEEVRQNDAPAVVIDDAPPDAPTAQPESHFYGSTLPLLQIATLLFAFSMEVGAGLALREAWRSTGDTSEDWKAVRKELLQVRRRMAEIIHIATDLQNEPGIFADRFWRDFYRTMLSQAVRNAMTKLPVILLTLCLFAGHAVHAAERQNLVIAIDLSKSVASVGPDGKTDFQKNIDGVTWVLLQLSAGSRITVIGITDQSFAQPYILMSANVPDDPGYFGDRLNAAHAQLVAAWKSRAAKIEPEFKHTDILGALQLAAQIFAQEQASERDTLILFSDMRQSTHELDFEMFQVVPAFSSLMERCGPLHALRGVQVQILGVDAPGSSAVYWQSLRDSGCNSFVNLVQGSRALQFCENSQRSEPVE